MVKTLEEFPWLMDTMEVLSSEELSALEADDEINGEYNAYKKKLIKAFIALDEEAIAALSEELFRAISRYGSYCNCHKRNARTRK